MKLILLRVLSILLIGMGLLFGLPTPVQSAVVSINMALGGNGSTSWALNGLNPGSSGNQLVSIKNISRTPGKIDIWLSNVRGISGRDGSADLDKYLMLNLSGTGLTSAVPMPAKVSAFPVESSPLNLLYIPQLAPGDSVTLNWNWMFTDTGMPQNDAQGDGLVFDINYGMTEIISDGGSVPTPTVIQPTNVAQPTPPVSPGGPSGGGRTIGLEVPGAADQSGITDEGVTTGVLSVSTPDNAFAISINPGTKLWLSNQNRQNPTDLSKVGDSIPAKIEVTVPDINTIPPYPDGWIPVSPPYDINAVTNGFITGVQMDAPALLVIKYIESLLPQKLDDLAAFYYNYQVGWTQLNPPEGFIAEGPEVAAEVDHFSLFVVLAKPGEVGKPPANIVIQKLTVNPPRIMVGQSSEVRVKITNKGGLPGEYNVVLKMDGKVQKTQIVHLDAGQSTEIALILSPGQNGIYTLMAGPAYGDLVVDPGVMPDVSEANYWWLLCIALGVSTLLFTFFRRKQLDETEESENK